VQEAAAARDEGAGAGTGAGAGAEPASEEEADGEEYEAREDDLDAPRDYDDYTDNAHLALHHD
jgi:hypothetical protein